MFVLICFDFPDVGLVGRNRVLFYYCFFFGSVFLDVLVFLLCLVSRDICCCVFEVIFVPSAEYQSGVHSFLSAGVSYQSSLL